MYMGILNLKDPKCFKKYPIKWESCSQSTKCRQARNIHNSTSPSKCRNTNFSNETAERILMSRVQLLMLYLAMTTHKEHCKVGFLGLFFCFFLFSSDIVLAFTCCLTEGCGALLWSISWMSAQNKGCYQLRCQSHSCITIQGFMLSVKAK